jgi:hypothetical protein
MSEAKTEIAERIKQFDQEIAATERLRQALIADRRNFILESFKLTPGAVVRKKSGELFRFTRIESFYPLHDGSVYFSISGNPRKKNGEWSELTRYIGDNWELVSEGQQ